jgi:parvulin-like peptidyl-prolyl isomerase
MKQTLSKLIQDPLTIFIVCGALVFLFYEYTLQDKRPSILLSKAAQVQLVEDFEAIRGEKASKEDLADIFQSYLIDELLFQEALEEKLHLHDPTTRSSLIDIMHYRIAQSIEAPSNEELVAYFAANIRDYYTETTYTFTHVFFSSLPNNTQDYLSRLNNEEILTGEDFIHGNTFSNMTSGLLSGVFGKDFSTNLQQLSTNEWEGPIKSNYGVHFVRLTEKLEPRVAPFSEVKQRVEDDYMQDKGDQAIMRKYKELEAKYETALEP